MRIMGFELFRRKPKEDPQYRFEREQQAWAAKCAETAAELNDPRAEALSEQFFKESVHASGLVYEGGEHGPYADEYRATVKLVEGMEREHGDDLFLYTTRKAALFKKRKLPYSPINHWRGYFVRPHYIERLGNRLSSSEISFLFTVVASELRENVDEVVRENEMLEQYSSVEPNWKRKYWIEKIELHQKNIKALLPLLTKSEKKKAESLLQESTLALRTNPRLQ